MKKIFIGIGLITGLFSLLCLNACKEDIAPVVDELDFTRAFAPIELKAEISNITTVTLTWSSVKNADHYVVEIYEGTEFITSALIHTEEVPATVENTVSYSYVLPAGDTQFSAKVWTVSSLDGVAESKWVGAEFKSAPENLFLGYKSEMTGFQTVTIRWKPGSAASSLLFIKGTVETPYTLTSDEITSGVKVITGIGTGSYAVKLMNSTFSRGTVNVVAEGDVLLASGSDLLAAITAADPGSVIMLEEGGTYIFTGNTTISKSIKVRALTETNMPVLAAASGASTTAPMFLIDAALTPNDSIVFQNVTMTGYINNNSVEGMITGVYDQGTSNACNIGTLKFKGCVLNHFSRQLIRLRGTATQYINNFIVDGCTLYDYGTNSTSYGIISSNTATATLNNIKFTNSTIYNFLSYLVLYTNNAASTSITVSNCSLNQITWTAGSTSRYIIDANATTLSNGISISNCIFGSTAALHTNGVRTTGTLTITNSYRTSDYDDAFTPAYSIMASLTAYTGASTDLWTDPLNGVFTLKDTAFTGKSTAGDPRYRL